MEWFEKTVEDVFKPCGSEFKETGSPGVKVGSMPLVEIGVILLLINLFFKRIVTMKLIIAFKTVQVRRNKRALSEIGTLV